MRDVSSKISGPPDPKGLDEGGGLWREKRKVRQQKILGPKKNQLEFHELKHGRNSKKNERLNL